MVDIKACRICGAEFCRSSRESFARWERRICCGSTKCRSAIAGMQAKAWKHWKTGTDSEHDLRAPEEVVDFLSARGLVALSQEPEETRLWWLRQMPWHVRAHAQRMMR